jgi:hypothetical protein
MKNPLHALTPGKLGTRALYAKWAEPPDIADAAQAFVTHGASYFVCWHGADGAFYGLARVFSADAWPAMKRAA